MKFAEQKPTQMVMATIVVAMGLLGFAMVTLLNYTLLGLKIPMDLIQKITIVIGLIFLARAIGCLRKEIGLFIRRFVCI